MTRSDSFIAGTIVLALAAGCGSPSVDFIECRDNSSCDLASGGQCLVNPTSGHQFCAYPDGECESGLRWSDLDVEDEISGTCVAEEVQDPDAGIDALVPDSTPGSPSVDGIVVAARVAPGATVPVECQATDPDGDSLIYEWDFSAGTPSGSGAVINWTAPATEGLVTVTCSASDGSLMDSAMTDIQVLVTDGLIAGYFFNGDGADFSGTGHNATIPGGMSFVPDRFGQAGGALRFNGVDNVISLPSENDFDLVTMSIVTFIKPVASNNNRGVLGKAASSGSGPFSLRVVEDDAGAYPGHGRFFWGTSGGGSYSAYTTGPLSTSQYNSFVAVRTVTDARLYIGGSLVTSQTHDGDVVAGSSSAVTIGEDGPAVAAYFYGDIDEIRFYNRALTAAEIQAIASGAAVE